MLARLCRSPSSLRVCKQTDQSQQLLRTIRRAKNPPDLPERGPRCGCGKGQPPTSLIEQTINLGKFRQLKKIRAKQIALELDHPRTRTTALPTPVMMWHIRPDQHQIPTLKCRNRITHLPPPLAFHNPGELNLRMKMVMMVKLGQINIQTGQ